MQKVLIIPKMSTKNSYFVSRLVVFNETFAPLHKTDNGSSENLCVLWHEAISGRCASHVASSYCQVIKKSNPAVTEFLFWADNCSAQNKNWTLYSALIKIVNQDWGANTITIKYFESGHSYMKADSVHGRIGKKWKTTSNVFDMDDLQQLIESADEKNKVMHMSFHNFFEFKDISRKRISNKNKPELLNLPKLHTIKVVQFRKGSNKMFSKTNIDDEEFSESLFARMDLIKDFPKPVKSATGLNLPKKEKICKDLVPLMPARKRLFWTEMKTSKTAKDLCSNRDN